MGMSGYAYFGPYYHGNNREPAYSSQPQKDDKLSPEEPGSFSPDSSKTIIISSSSSSISLFFVADSERIKPQKPVYLWSYLSQPTWGESKEEEQEKEAEEEEEMPRTMTTLFVFLLLFGIKAMIYSFRVILASVNFPFLIEKQ